VLEEEQTIPDASMDVVLADLLEEGVLEPRLKRRRNSPRGVNSREEE